jgi:uncharacterized protein (TIGR00730 family)
MRFTSKVFAPYRGVRKVTVFGSARTLPDDPAYATAKLFGRRLAEAGYMVITGGGGGIMAAVNEGAGPEHSFGVNIRLPFEEKPNPVIEGNPRSINYKYFFNRKVAFLKESDAMALFPGGFGTLDEAMEALTLVQTGKRNPMPLVLVETPGSSYWARVTRFLEEELLPHRYICPSDMALFERVSSAVRAGAAGDPAYLPPGRRRDRGAGGPVPRPPPARGPHRALRAAGRGAGGRRRGGPTPARDRFQPEGLRAAPEPDRRDQRYLTRRNGRSPWAR